MKSKNRKPLAKKQLKATKGGLLPAVRQLPAVQMPTDQTPTAQINAYGGFQGGVFVGT